MNTHRAGGPARTPGRFITDPEVRRWLYGIAVAVVPLLIALGVVTEAHGGLWIAIVGAVLAPVAPALAAANTPRDTAD